MAIDISNQKQWVKDLMAFHDRPNQGIDGPFSWTGNSGQSVTVSYSLDHTKLFSPGSEINGVPSDAGDIGLSEDIIKRHLEAISNVANITFIRNESDPDILDSIHNNPQLKTQSY